MTHKRQSLKPLIAVLTALLALPVAAAPNTSTNSTAQKSAGEQIKFADLLKFSLTPEILEKQFSELKKSAEKGDADAQYRLGIKYELGSGVKKDYVKARAWYEKAAAQGNADAQNNLGWMYQKGLGVQQDYAKAHAWYEKAAAQGNASAEKNLQYMREKGLIR